MRRWLIRAVLPLVLVALAGAGVAMAATASMQASSGTVRATQSKTFGMVLVAANGHALYRYTPDTKGVRTCSGACLKFWPPLLVKAGTKPTVGAGAIASLVGTIKAPQGMLQVTYAGFPLYFFAEDHQAGQMKGQGFGGKWFVVNTHGSLVRHAVKASSGQTTTGTSTSSGSWG